MDKDTLMNEVNKINGVQGSMIVSKDGLVQTNSLKDALDPNLAGAVLSSVFTNIDSQSKRMQRGKLKRFTIETETESLTVNEVNLGAESLLVFSQAGKDINLEQFIIALDSLPV